MAVKNLGVWMDYSNADLIDVDTEKNNQTIKSDFTFDVKGETLSRSENIMHNKERQMNEAFYKKIAEEIVKYDKVLLFGPTNAKLELCNFLDKDSHFKHITIDVESADKMSENEKMAFVRKHFEDQ